MSLRLIIEDDEGTTTVVPLGADAITIGRQQGNTIQLTEKNVSRRHARLYPEQAAWIVEDLGSYNGVKVNAQKVEGRVVLQEGDVIQIGDYHLALTENVDRRTLNYDRPPEAANDVEPLLVSSSTDLPRLSPEELASLSSGPHTPYPGSNGMLDSGSVPAMSSPHYARERKGAPGLLIAGGLVVIGALALGAFWLASTGNAPPGAKVADANPTASAEQAAESSPSDHAANGEVPAAIDPDDDEVVEAVEPAEPGGDDASDVEAVDPDSQDEAVVAIEAPEDDDPPEPTPEARAPKSSSPKTTSRKPSSSASSRPRSSDSPPKPPPAPPVDVDQLLTDARQASMKNQPAKAYDLARKAYKEKPSQDALTVMATSACKMGDTAKAKFAINKLSSSRKDDAKRMCELMGVSI